MADKLRSPDARALGGRRAFASLMVLASLTQAIVYSTRLVATYRALELGAGPFELGLMASAFGLLSLVAAVSIGRLVDRHGEAPFICVGGLLLGVAAVLAATAD